MRDNRLPDCVGTEGEHKLTSDVYWVVLTTSVLCHFLACLLKLIKLVKKERRGIARRLRIRIARIPKESKIHTNCLPFGETIQS